MADHSQFGLGNSISFGVVRVVGVVWLMRIFLNTEVWRILVSNFKPLSRHKFTARIMALIYPERLTWL
jgi:hypothetical protein